MQRKKWRFQIKFSLVNAEKCILGLSWDGDRKEKLLKFIKAVMSTKRNWDAESGLNGADEQSLFFPTGGIIEWWGDISIIFPAIFFS